MTEVSWGATSPTAARQYSLQTSDAQPTINAVDAYDIFDDRGALVRGFPVQQHAVCLDSSERYQRRDGNLEAEQVDELFDGLREDPVGAECHPAAMLGAIGKRMWVAEDVPEEGQQHQGRLHPARRQENESLHIVAGDMGRPVERVDRVGEHGGDVQAARRPGSRCGRRRSRRGRRRQLRSSRWEWSLVAWDAGAGALARLLSAISPLGRLHFMHES